MIICMNGFGTRAYTRVDPLLYMCGRCVLTSKNSQSISPEGNFHVILESSGYVLKIKATKRKYRGAIPSMKY